MTQTARALSPLFLGVALLTLGNGLFGILLGLRMTADGYSATDTGIVLGAYFAGFIPAMLTAPAIIARVGHIRGFAAFAALAAAAVLLLPIVPAFWVWVGLRVVIGYCLAALFMTVESWLNVRAENHVRGRILGLYQAVILVAVSVAQLLVGYGDPRSFTLFSVVAIFYCLSLVPIALTRAAAPAIHAPSRLGLGTLMRMSPLAVAMTFGAGLINSAYSNMGAVFAVGIGMSAVDAGRFMAIGVLSGLAMQWPFGWLSDRFDRRHVIAGMTFSVAAASIALMLASIFAPALVFALVAAFGGMSFALYAQGVAHANDYAAREDLVAVSAGLLLAHGVGAILAPPLAGIVMDAWGPAALWAYTGVMAAGLGGFCLYRMRQREPKPVTEQAPFAPVPVTTPLAAQLDPRVEPETELGRADAR
ncbi:MAG: MFS transporter [Alphaproteobacteria bacterium]|nr:MFS transporter [Alphaproteobacteria bacterium]